MLLTEKLTALADAVREKTGGEKPLTLDEMRTEISALSTEPQLPYVDSRQLSAVGFCFNNQNMEFLALPEMGVFAAEDISYFFYMTQMRDIPSCSLQFPNAKQAHYMFASMRFYNVNDYGHDLSRVELFLPSLEDTTSMFESTSCGVMPRLHFGKSCRKVSRMFYNCQYITEVDLREATGIEIFDYIFNYAIRLQTVHLDMGSATSYKNMFKSCIGLIHLSIGSLKITNSDFRLDDCTSLSVDSLVGVLNALQSNVGEETTHTVILGSENLAKLTDAQKQIAIDKNLTLA